MKWRSGTLDDLYFEWLYEQVADVNEIDPRKTYWDLLRKLYCSEFLYFIPNDDNRAQDGFELRDFFLQEEGLQPDPYWETLPCSIFEMLVSLARRMEFEGGRSVVHWFWQFIRNLELDIFTDEFCMESASGYHVMVYIAQSAVEALNSRSYSYSGHDGGLFPLNDPEEDQSEVELWYQMSAYLREEV